MQFKNYIVVDKDGNIEERNSEEEAKLLSFLHPEQCAVYKLVNVIAPKSLPSDYPYTK